MSDPEECNTATEVWTCLIEAKGCTSQILGAAVDNRSFRGPGGYRLHDETLLPHLFLAVGECLTLFDPTAWQRAIREDGGPELAMYVESCPGGRDLLFEDWRSWTLEAER